MTVELKAYIYDIFQQHTVSEHAKLVDKKGVVCLDRALYHVKQTKVLGDHAHLFFINITFNMVTIYGTT